MKETVSSLKNCAEFRFYEELNDFLSQEQRKQPLQYRFNGTPGIRDPIQVFGVPHSEVDLIIVDGESVGFDYKLQDQDRVSVYPVFTGLDISPIVKLRDNPLRNITFIADINLGKLARLLRLFGFDTLLANHLSDKEIVKLAADQKRIILTRDRRLLYNKIVSHGYWVRSVQSMQQLAEVVRRFELASLIRPFYRCVRCNGLIDAVEKKDVLHLLQPKTKFFYEKFYRCRDCEQIYWEGSHVEKIKNRFAGFLRRESHAF